MESMRVVDAKEKRPRGEGFAIVRKWLIELIKANELSAFICSIVSGSLGEWGETYGERPPSYPT